MSSSQLSSSDNRARPLCQRTFACLPSVGDPDPGLFALFTPGSGIGNKFFPYVSHPSRSHGVHLIRCHEPHLVRSPVPYQVHGSVPHPIPLQYCSSSKAQLCSSPNAQLCSSPNAQLCSSPNAQLCSSATRAAKVVAATRRGSVTPIIFPTTK